MREFSATCVCTSASVAMMTAPLSDSLGRQEGSFRGVPGAVV